MALRMLVSIVVFLRGRYSDSWMYLGIEHIFEAYLLIASGIIILETSF